MADGEEVDVERSQFVGEMCAPHERLGESGEIVFTIVLCPKFLLSFLLSFSAKVKLRIVLLGHASVKNRSQLATLHIFAFHIGIPIIYTNDHEMLYTALCAAASAVRCHTGTSDEYLCGHVTRDVSECAVCDRRR